MINIILHILKFDYGSAGSRLRGENDLIQIAVQRWW